MNDHTTMTPLVYLKFGTSPSTDEWCIDAGDGDIYQFSHADLMADGPLDWLTHLRKKTWFTARHEDEFLACLINNEAMHIAVHDGGSPSDHLLLARLGIHALLNPS